MPRKGGTGFRTPPQAAAQGVVRQAALERTLEQFNHEQQQKMTQSLVQYHQMFIADLTNRIRHLEKPFHRRWPIDVGRMILSVFAKVFILLSWQITADQIQKEAWRAKRYQGLTRKLVDIDGFLYMLKPFHLVVRFYDSYRRIRQKRRDDREAAAAEARAEAAKAEAEAEPEQPERVPYPPPEDDG